MSSRFVKDSETVTGSPLDCEAGIETGRRRFSCASDPHSDSIRDSRTDFLWGEIFDFLSCFLPCLASPTYSHN